RRPEDPEDPFRPGTQGANDARLVMAGIDALEPRRHPLADAGGPAMGARQDPDRRRLPAHRDEGLREELAVVVDAGDLDDADLRERPGRLQLALAASLRVAVALDVPEKALEGDAIARSHLEGARDLALADRGRA